MAARIRELGAHHALSYVTPYYFGEYLKMNISKKPIVQVKHLGNLGNRMLQYMAASKLSEKLENVGPEGIEIPEFGISVKRSRNIFARKLNISSDRTIRIDFDAVKRYVVEKEINIVSARFYSSHVDNIPDWLTSKSMFTLDLAAVGYGDNDLVINVRGAEILNAVHPEYTVVPVEFYVDIIQKTGLNPIFLGQLGGSSSYITSLRKAFPKATFVSSQGALRDFSIIAKSKNIVIAISTFSWLAAFLSNANNIIMPLSGFYNPLQYPAVNFMPETDTRYKYYLFPENRAVPDEDIEVEHAKLSGQWREVFYEELRPVLSSAARRLTWSPEM